MIEGLKPYGEYKESGQKWLGSVPAHWDVRRTKLILREVDSRSTTGKEQLLRVSQYTGVTQRKAADGSDAPDTRAASLVGYKRVSVNDLVINIMLAWNGSMGVSRFDGIASPAYCVYRLNKGAQPWYFHQLFRLPLYKGRIKAVSTGVIESRLRLYSDDLGRIEAILPPPDEQAAIVRFLDHANRKIDGFIRAKRKLIGLLNEQKQAIIHRAVTRGLHPKHWEVPRVKQCARKISKGTTPSTEGRAILESGPVRFLKAENISAGCITNKPLCFIDEETNRVIRRSQLAENDILFVIAGATLGKTAVVSGEILPANTNQAVAFIRPNSRVVPRFLELWLQSPRIKELIWLNAVQSAQPNLSMADLGNFVTPVPPRNEQQQILDFVKEATKPMSDAIARTEREIALMQEYRTRLTADLVTGKLDVREAAAKLPDLPTDTAAEPLTDEAPDDTETEEAEA
ncbi:MAG: restriction endonuclease subunit S [Planctomycetota bacterium]|nr:restriction endonuclease subunit S [Planctomycetota bacterium]